MVRVPAAALQAVGSCDGTARTTMWVALLRLTSGFWLKVKLKRLDGR
jgi:hypothetical protein